VGLNRAIGRLYGIEGRVLPGHVREVGRSWSPFATVACWYLWRSEDVVTME
jgi:DNA-3-methyladenine glycosylase II